MKMTPNDQLEDKTPGPGAAAVGCVVFRGNDYVAPKLETGNSVVENVMPNGKFSAVDNEGGDTGHKDEKNLNRRTRRKSKYLSPPFTDPVKGKPSKESESPGDKSIQNSSPSVVKCSKKRKQPTKSTASPPAPANPETITASSAELLLQLHIVACDTPKLRHNKAFHPVKLFYNRFRASVFCSLPIEEQKKADKQVSQKKSKTPVKKPRKEMDMKESDKKAPDLDMEKSDMKALDLDMAKSDKKAPDLDMAKSDKKVPGLHMAESDKKSPGLDMPQSDKKDPGIAMAESDKKAPGLDIPQSGKKDPGIAIGESDKQVPGLDIAKSDKKAPGLDMAESDKKASSSLCGVILNFSSNSPSGVNDPQLGCAPISSNIKPQRKRKRKVEAMQTQGASEVTQIPDLNCGSTILDPLQATSQEKAKLKPEKKRMKKRIVTPTTNMFNSPYFNGNSTNYSFSASTGMNPISDPNVVSPPGFCAQVSTPSKPTPPLKSEPVEKANTVIGFHTNSNTSSPLQKSQSSSAMSLDQMKQSLEFMTSMLEKSGDTISPVMRANLEKEIKNLLKKVDPMIRSPHS